MRRVIFLLFSVVMLGLAGGLRQLDAGWVFIVPAERDVLYATTFTDAWGDWSQQDRRGAVTTIAEGALTLSFDATTTRRELLRSVNTYTYRDFDLHVRATALDGPLNNSFGVAFRQPDDDNGYLFYISSDGYYSVWREVVGEERWPLSAWIPSEAIVQGVGPNVTNELRVVAQGDTFRFYVNDTLLSLCVPDDPDGKSTYTSTCLDGTMQEFLVDDTLPVGGVGVVIETLEDGPLAVAFDDVRLLGHIE